MKCTLQVAGLNNAKASINFIERTWKEEFPEYNFKYKWLDEHVTNTYAQETLIFDALQIGALIAIVLGGSGLFALVAFFAAMKTKEVGIRKTLGASVRQLIIELSSGLIKLILLSIIFGTVVGWWLLTEWMNGFIYKTELTYLTYLISVIITMIIAGLTIVAQTLRTAQANPVDSLKYE